MSSDTYRQWCKHVGGMMSNIATLSDVPLNDACNGINVLLQQFINDYADKLDDDQRDIVQRAVHRDAILRAVHSALNIVMDDNKYMDVVSVDIESTERGDIQHRINLVSGFVKNMPGLTIEDSMCFNSGNVIITLDNNITVSVADLWQLQLNITHAVKSMLGGEAWSAVRYFSTVYLEHHNDDKTNGSVIVVVFEKDEL